MAAVVVISSGCGLRIEVLRRNQPNKSKLHISLYKPLYHLTFFLNSYTQATDGALQL